MRFPVEIVRRVRERVGTNFIIIYRLSMLDLVEGGSTRSTRSNSWPRAHRGDRRDDHQHRHRLARGTHPRPSRPRCLVPASPGDQGTHGHRRDPLITTNRIHARGGRAGARAHGHADMVSMARPFLADADFVAKAAAGQADRINTCIACNQACLDHTSPASSRPAWSTRALATDDPHDRPGDRAQACRRRRARPAGLATATTATGRGHHVTLFDGRPDRRTVQPGQTKSRARREFHETLRYFEHELEETGVDVKLGTRVTAGDLTAYDVVAWRPA